MSTWSEAEVLFSPATEELRFLPEGPYALGDGRFSWVAIQHGAAATSGSLNIYDVLSGKRQHFPLPGRPGFARPTTDPGKFIVGAERELAVFDLKTGAWDVFCRGVDSDVTDTVINDGTMFGDNLVFGTKDLEFKTKKAGLYLFRGSDRRLIQLRGDQICSNGKAIVASEAGDRLQLYDIDTPTRKIVRYDLDIAAAKLTNEKTVVDLSTASGVPDGMVLTPDKKSAIVALYNSEAAEFGCTQQYGLASGALEASWRTPHSPQNTCPLLLRMPDGSIKLVITTAIENMPTARRSNAVHAGCLFIANTPFVSLPAAERIPFPP